MIDKTKSIVLQIRQYKDNLSIVELFTSRNGKITCFLPVSKNKKSLIKSNMFQPLSLLELEIDLNTKKEIHRIREAKIHFPLNQIPFHPIKLSLAQFIAEVIAKTSSEHDENPTLYSFFENAIHILDLTDKSVANFHIVFLLKLTAFLGFYPNTDNYSDNSCFDLVNGTFVQTKALHNHHLDLKQSRTLNDLLALNFENFAEFPLSRMDRQEIVSYIFEYYKLHLSGFQGIKSFEVLKMLF